MAEGTDLRPTEVQVLMLRQKSTMYNLRLVSYKEVCWFVRLPLKYAEASYTTQCLLVFITNTNIVAPIMLYLIAYVYSMDFSMSEPDN